MSPLALELVCHFLSRDSKTWTAKDLKDLAAIQRTCRDAQRLCARTSRQRKPAAQAHKAMMEDLEEYIEYKVSDARGMAKDDGDEEWVHPFTGEVCQLVWTARELDEQRWQQAAAVVWAREWAREEEEEQWDST